MLQKKMRGPRVLQMLSRFFLYLSRLFDANKDRGHERDGTYHNWESEE